MDIEDIKRRLARPAVLFTTGGFRPTHAEDESWIGKVFLYRAGETVPRDEAGRDMLPLAQLYVADLPFAGPLPRETRLLTVFAAATGLEPLQPMGENWVVREYGADAELVRKEIDVPASFIRPFPLRAELLDADFPLWEDEIPVDVVDAVLACEEAGLIDSYWDIADHAYGTKIGGYPSFCQGGIDPGPGFDFVFQISSDEKANLGVCDGGSLMFWRQRDTGDWALYFDSY